MKPAEDRVALFGGTFDPVHHGHLDLAAAARQACRLGRVTFVPCSRSPFKAGEPEASADHRCRMLRLAIEERGWTDWAFVSRFEIDREAPSYSWQTVAHFREQRPEAEIFWILGADQWEQIDRWAEPEKLRQWLHFIVVTRRGHRISERDGWRFEPVEFEHPASATAIRSGTGDTGWLPSSVAKYCADHHLYRFG